MNFFHLVMLQNFLVIILQKEKKWYLQASLLYERLAPTLRRDLNVNYIDETFEF